MKTVILLVAFALTASAADVTFLLSTNGNQNAFQSITPDTNSIQNSIFNKANPTKFVIHTYKESAKSPMIAEIAEKKFAQTECNIIFVDWAQARAGDYKTANSATIPVGKLIAQFIDFLNANFNMKFETLEVIGHGLGAHVAGFAGKNVKNGRIDTILAIDRAIPLYGWSRSRTSLARTDATHVIYEKTK